MLVNVFIPATILAKSTKIYKIYVTMAVLHNRCDLIGATRILVVPRLIYKDSPDPMFLGLGAARLVFAIQLENIEREHFNRLLPS